MYWPFSCNIGVAWSVVKRYSTVSGLQFVVDQALTRCISQIRTALNDKHPHSYLQTLHKRSYRLIAPDCCTALPR